MPLAVTGVSQHPQQIDTDPAPKPASKPTETEQIKLLSEQGKSDQQIADAVGLPETLVASTLGDTSASSGSAVSSASALVKLSARLSVYG